MKDLKEKLARIDTEEEATNTVENFTNTLNKIVDKDKGKYQSIALVSNFYHLPRIAKMAEKFRVEGATSSAEAHISKRNKHYNKFLSDLFYTDTDPDNEKNIAERPEDLIINPDYLKTITTEARWQHGMEIPMYWFPQAVTVNPERLKRMMQENPELQGLQPEAVAYMLSLSPEERNKLREMPSEELANLEATLPPKQAS